MQSLGINSGVLYDKLRLETGLSTSNIGIAGLITHAHKSSPFDEQTGEFKASVVGPIENRALKHGDSSMPLVENESNQEVTTK